MMVLHLLAFALLRPAIEFALQLLIGSLGFFGQLIPFVYLDVLGGLDKIL